MKTARQVIQERMNGVESEAGYKGLQERRMAFGLSQDEVAAALGFDPIQISRWETGARKVNLEQAFKLAAFYETTVDELFAELKVQVQP